VARDDGKPSVRCHDRAQAAVIANLDRHVTRFARSVDSAMAIIGTCIVFVIVIVVIIIVVGF
jgi:lipopolysaccharide/colanic/teichoic acid biosynthesis glycosyltransferase